MHPSPLTSPRAWVGPRRGCGRGRTPEWSWRPISSVIRSGGIEFVVSQFPYEGDHTPVDLDVQWRLRDDGAILVHGHTASTESPHATPPRDVPEREHAGKIGGMVKRKYLNTVESVARVVQAERKARGMTQADLARRAGVGRRFIHDIENGHPRAELGKVLVVLETLNVHALALPSVATTKRLNEVNLDEVIERHA